MDDVHERFQVFVQRREFDFSMEATVLLKQAIVYYLSNDLNRHTMMGQLTFVMIVENVGHNHSLSAFEMTNHHMHIVNLNVKKKDE